VFADKETAAAVVEHVDANPMVLDGRQLIVSHYMEPPHHVPEGRLISVGAQSTLGGHDIFARKMCMKN